MKFLTYLFLLSSIAAIGQVDFDNYRFIESNGPIPNDFYDWSPEKYASELVELEKKQKEDLSKVKDQYIVSTSYEIKKIMRSGLVTYNDPLSNYCNKILDILLVNQPDLRKKIRVYLLKSTEANAFSTNNGIIFVTVGLLAQVENEAQLAYVLSHEVAHYTKGHHAKDYILRDKYENDKNLTYTQKLNSLFSYSKEQEFEADKYGYLNYYSTANYATSQVDQCFDMLLYSHLPFDEVEFKLDFFNIDTMKLPKEFLVEKYNEIESLENVDDSKMTHPNILKRRIYMSTFLQESGTDNGSLFLLDKQEFDLTQKIARFELSHLFNLEYEFEQAFYNSYLLLQKYPNNQFLETNIVESIYSLNFYKNRGSYNSAHEKSKNIEGYRQQVNQVFDKIQSNELNLTALRFSWKLATKYPNDDYIKQLRDSVISDVSKYYKNSINNLPTKFKSPSDTSQASTEGLTKTEKIKLKRTSQTSSTFFDYSLVGLRNLTDLYDAYDKLILERAKYANEDSLLALKKNQKKTKGLSLGIKHTLMLPPYYELYMPNGKFSDYIKAYDTRRKDFVVLIDKMTNKIGLQTTKFSLENVGENDKGLFNDYALFTQWIIQYDSQSEEGYLMSSRRYMAEIAKRYNSQYFTWVAIDYEGRYAYLKVVTIDFTTGKVLLSYRKEINASAKDVLKSNLYYVFMQLYRDKKS